MREEREWEGRKGMEEEDGEGREMRAEMDGRKGMNGKTMS